MSNTPSDEEFGKLAEECGIGWAAGLGGMDDFLRVFARAVLAKWGTPQPVVREPLTQDQMFKLYLQSAMKERIFIRADWEQGVRDAEHAHGITQKGGGNAE